MSKSRVSLVLSSGGARGLAHIGAIQCLEAHDVDICSISGSSMGALVGGIYAAGRLEEYAHWVKALQRKDIVQLLDFGWGRGGGLFKGERIIDVLKELIGDHEIEQLPVTYTAVATDLKRKREIWINKGPLFAAIRASIAVPLVFAPVVSGAQTLIDGGVLNPLPIAPTLTDETDLIVAVDVNGADETLPAERIVSTPRASKSAEQKAEQDSEQEPEETLTRAIATFVDSLWPSKDALAQDHGMLDVALDAMDAMQVAIARQKLAVYSPDLTIQIPRNVAQFFEFDRAAELIDIGYERMAAALGAAETRSGD